MIARFFIDRPVFAVVISLIIVLAGGVAVFTLPITQYPNVTPPAVSVSTVYPGANATTVRDTVAAPIEEQVSGVEGMVYMSSRCANDGTYRLLVTFRAGMNSDMAQVLVQNRVSLALPVIPLLVQTEGISVKKTTPTTMMMVNLVSPDHRYDATFLSNYATIYLKDELGRVPGVADITYFGQRDYSIRAWLDPNKLAALNLTPGDVVTAITQQNLQVAAGQIGQPPNTSSAQQFQLTINTLGRLSNPDQFAEIIVKTAQPGATTSTGAASSASTAPASATVPGASGGSMSQQSSASNGAAPPVTGIVRLRDVVRENEYVMRLRFDPARLAQWGLRSDQVVDALQPRPVSIQEDPDAQPVKGQTLTWLATYRAIEPPSSLELASGEINVRKGSGQAPRLGDLLAADDGIEHRPDLDQLGVQLGSQQYEQTCTLDGQPSVALSIFQLPGSNALDTAQGVYAKMEELKARFPTGLDYRVVYDTTPFIRESVDEVFVTLRDAVILVAIVVLVFLQDWKAMILPMIDVPVSLIGTFAVMSLLGFTLNNLTLFGLVLAIGIVVDDAIVVLENIERQIATGLDVRSATIKAMEEITGPVLAITLVLASVFVPCCFLGGITGQFFRQFAVTIAVSTIISAINALTMTPSRAVLIFKSEQVHESAVKGQGHMPAKEALPWWIFGVVGGVLSIWLAQTFLSDRFPGLNATWSAEFLVALLPGALVGGLVGWFVIRPVNIALGWFFQIFNRAFDRLTALYGATVSGVLRVSFVVLLLYGGLLGLTGWQLATVPTGFIPDQDKGYLILNVQLADAASVERTERLMARIEQIARRTPGVEHTVGISGQSLILNANAPNLGSMYVLLKPFDERRSSELSAAAIGATIENRCHEGVRGAIVQAFGAPPVEGLGTTGGFKIIIEDRGNLGLKELQRVGDQISQRANHTRELQGVFNGSRADTPWLYLDIDRSQCLALGVQVSDVFNTLQYYLGSFYVNNFNEFGRTWQVNIQADQSFRNSVADILELQVRNNQGQMIRLGNFMDVRDTSGPVAVLRYNLYSATAITGAPAAGTSSGQAADLMQTIVDQELPPSMASEWTELMYLQLQAGNTAYYAFGLAVAFVFLVLAAQYESWTLPLAIILVAPLCLLCSVIGVQWESMEVTIFTQIGFVVLVGLASKNAILIVEFAKQQQEAGKPLREAIVDATRLRLRPILMTSFAFILGVLPLVIAHGAGAEMRRSLGVAVFSGMLGVTSFGIFLTPVFYYLVQRLLPKPPAHPISSAKPQTARLEES
ncbi:MAG TPA: efflux RND transporter permease subunit [Pirellulales bacterium]|nr:efflux RND transporter permease subunit [Pirellulales bacterium]